MLVARLLLLLFFILQPGLSVVTVQFFSSLLLSRFIGADLLFCILLSFITMARSYLEAPLHEEIVCASERMRWYHLYAVTCYGVYHIMLINQYRPANNNIYTLAASDLHISVVRRIFTSWLLLLR